MTDIVDIYEGPVVFVDGVHYPVGEDDHADTGRPLRWAEGGYRDAEEGEPLHNDAHHQREATLAPNEVILGAPGAQVYPVGVSVVTYGDGVYFLLDENEEPVRDHPLTWDSTTNTFQASGAAE